MELTERFADLVAFLDARGGRYMRKRAEWARELGLGENALRKMLNRGVELGVLELRRGHPPMIGLGTLPNEYVLTMSHATFLATRHQLHAGRLVAKAAEREGIEATPIRTHLPEVPAGLAEPVTVDDPNEVDVAAWQDWSEVEF